MEEVRSLPLLPLHSHASQGRAARALDSLSPIHQPIPAATLPSVPGSYLPLPLPPGHYSQYTTHIPKPGEQAPAYPYYIAHVAPPGPPHANQEGATASCHQPMYYPIFHAPFPTQAVYPHTQGFITVRHNP